MRSTRATELIEEYPAHMVNAWMGHTEAVAMEHYRQATGKAAEKFYEQAAGKKQVQDFTHVHADTGCFGVENDENACVDSCTFFPDFQGCATDYTEKQGIGEIEEWRGQDSNLRP